MVKQVWRVGGVALLVVLSVTLGVFFLQSLAGPSFVDELTVVNPTAYTIDVRVSEGDDSWLGLGVADPGDEHIFQDVVDQGDTWVFEFSHAGEVAGHLEVSRDALADGDWRVEVPASVGLRLAKQGFKPSPKGF